jgi:hypothetical protein
MELTIPTLGNVTTKMATDQCTIIGIISRERAITEKMSVCNKMEMSNNILRNTMKKGINFVEIGTKDRQNHETTIVEKIKHATMQKTFFCGEDAITSDDRKVPISSIIDDQTVSPHSHNNVRIINLSQRHISVNEKKILEKGLKFTPTPRRDSLDLIKDTEEFCRKLRLREYFENEENVDKSLVRNKSKFKPQPNRDKHLDDFIKCLQSSARRNNSINTGTHQE